MKIVDIELKKLVQRVDKLGYSIELTKKAKTFLGDQGFDQKYGARPLSRAIQRHLEDAIAEEIVSDQLKEGDKILIDWDGKAKKLDLAVEKE